MQEKTSVTLDFKIKLTICLKLVQFIAHSEGCTAEGLIFTFFFMWLK